MDIIEILSELEEVVDKGFEIPFIKKTFINKEEVLEMLNDISLQLPEELRMSKSIVEDRQKILADAQKQADMIIKSAEQKIVALIDEHEITKRANEEANEIIMKAQKNAREIRLGALHFADNTLEKLENKSKEIANDIKQCRAELRQ